MHTENKSRAALLLVLLLLAELFLGGCATLRAVFPSPSPTALPTGTPSPIARPTAVPSPTPAPTSEPTATPVPTPSPDPILQKSEELLSAMTLREKVLQMFIVSPEQLIGAEKPVKSCGKRMKAALQEYPVGGVLYFGRNFVDRSQTQQLLADMQAASPLALFAAVDEEGGDVARVADNPNMGTTVFPPMGFLDDPEEGYDVGMTIGSELAELGFNLDFAPVADVNSNPWNPVIGWRAFGEDAETASTGVSACVRGFNETGILCTLKHFPGHGDTETDSHYGAAMSEKSLAALRECEFLPFTAGIKAGAPLVMMGHIALPNVTGSDVPASFSHEITTDLLRGELGFDGLIVTDSLDMGAIVERYSPAEAAVGPILAGVDLLLVPEDFHAAVNGVLDALEDGTLSEERIDESVRRILHTKLEAGIVPLGE